MLNSIKLLGVKITTNSEEEILKYVVSELVERVQNPSNSEKEKTPIVIFTPNPEQITAASRDTELAAILNQADIALPDGVGVVVGSKLLGLGLKSRITGVDFMQRLLEEVSEDPKLGAKRPVISSYFGGEKGVAVKAANCLQKSYKNITIGYASEAFDKDKFPKIHTDILFVGLGFPKQERWIMDNKDKIDTSIIMAVGGSFDFLSGKTPRAPRAVQGVGMEWLFRLVVQPWRIKRQARLLVFSHLIFKSWLSNRLTSTKN